MEMALASPRNVRHKLYEMLTSRTLCIQDIPRVSDHNPQKTMYTWFVNLREVNRSWKGMVYRSILNMRVRLEREQKWGLDKFPMGFRADPTAEQQEFLAKLEPREQKLNTMISRLSEMLAVMDEFQC